MKDKKQETQEPDVAEKKIPVPRAPGLTIKVTKAIIDRSVKGNSGHCMIADALKETRPKATAVGVDIQTIRFTDPDRGLRYTYLTPLIAQRAILNFDEGIKPKAFDFRLRSAGAWVVLAGTRPNKKKRPHDPALRAEVRANLKKDRLVSSGSDKVPRRVGGRPAKLPELSQRREFGLRVYRGNRESRRELAALLAEQK